MGIRPHAKLPGWYREESDPGRLQHWDGYSWDGRSRKAPIWITYFCDLELVEPDAGGRSKPRDGSDSDAVTHARQHAGRAAATAWEPIGAVGGEATGPELVAPRGRPSPGSSRAVTFEPRFLPSRRARPIALVTIALIIAVMVLGTTIEGARDGARSAPFGAALTSKADRICRSVLGVPSGRPATAAGLARAGVIGRTDATLSRLTTRIRKLSSSDGLAAGTQGWLTDVENVQADLRGYTTASRGAGNQSRLLLEQTRSDVASSDRVALADGLSGCTLLSSAPKGTAPIP